MSKRGRTAFKPSPFPLSFFRNHQVEEEEAAALHHHCLSFSHTNDSIEPSNHSSPMIHT